MGSAEEHADYPITVAEVMRKSFLMVDGMNTIRDVLLILPNSSARCLVVYKRHEADEYGVLLVSDIGRRVLATGRRPERINVYEVMAKPAITVPAEMDIANCARLFTRCGISRAPVVDAAGEIVGIVSLNDLVLRGMLPELAELTVSGDAEAASVAAQEQQQERPQQHADE
jgi:CBS domain-containing protein